jgi:hypothetical protein
MFSLQFKTSFNHILLGMLLEHASKKEFAIVFTNNYGDIIKDFIQASVHYTGSEIPPTGIVTPVPVL